MTHRRVASLAVVLALCAVASSGCKRLAERAEEKAIERSTGGQVTIDDKKGTLTIVADGGAVTLGAAATIPSDFPKEVAVYPGAKPQMVAKSLDPKGKQAWSVTMETPDPRDKVAAYYKANMTGFTQASSMDMGTSSMSVYQSPKYDVTVVVNSEGTKSMLSLTVASK
jgi:predicted phosphoribosyltransferase